MKRKMSVSGSFYPSRPAEITQLFASFNNRLEETQHQSLLTEKATKAIIVPHAGYVYSGFTANCAYRVLAKQSLSSIIVIGPSHRTHLHGISLCEASSYETPLGDIQRSSLLQELKARFSLAQKIPHVEHSTEVQFPFIKHYLTGVTIVEIIYGLVEPDEIQRIIEYALALPDTGVIISSDLSHFYSLEEARKIDSLCLKAIDNLDTSILQQGCEACGLTGIESMISSAHNLNLSPEILDYRTSADASDDTSRVVGYVSAIFS